MAKPDPKSNESRRDFMRHGFFRMARAGVKAFSGDLEGAAQEASQLGAAPPPKKAAPAPAAPAAAKKSDEPIWLNKAEGQRYQKLGRTNLMMSRLSLGCASIRKANSGIIREAVDRGVNFLDTAINYGESELAIAEVLPAIRDRVWICTKTPSLGRLSAPAGDAEREAELAKAIEEGIDSSLARLKADKIDLYMLQAVADPGLLASPAVEEALNRAKEKGKIVHAGVTTHRNVGNVFDAALKRSWCDVLTVPLNPINLASMLTFMDLARFKQVGVIGMRATAGLAALTDAQRQVKLNELPADWNVHQLAYLYMLIHAPCAGILMGLDAIEQVAMNLAVAAHDMTINDGVELDAVVYGELWPYCTICAEQRSISIANQERADELHFRRLDVPGMHDPLPPGPEEPLRVCENCQAEMDNAKRDQGPEASRQ